MDIKKSLKNYFTANIEFDDVVSYRRIVMLNSILSLFVVTFFIFVYINIALTHDYFVAALDAFTALMSIFSLWLLRRHQNVRQVAFIASIILIAFMIVFTNSNENTNFGIIWSIFIPYFSTMFNGRKVGLYLSVFFYTIMFIMAYDGIGVWNEGLWSFIDFTRFVIASILLTFVIYLSESAHEKADNELKMVRENEQKILAKLTEISVTDALTGAYNRRYFNEVFPHILKDAQEEDDLVSLFILDIDFFKEHNDTYGHYEGDVTLKKVAQKLASLIQYEGDLVFRIGGEEFAGVIHTRSKDEIQELIESINQGIEELEIEHSATKLPSKKLTVSIGVCTNYPSNERQLKHFYKQADDALYRAKSEGRNKTVFAR